MRREELGELSLNTEPKCKVSLAEMFGTQASGSLRRLWGSIFVCNEVCAPGSPPPHLSAHSYAVLLVTVQRSLTRQPPGSPEAFHTGFEWMGKSQGMQRKSRAGCFLPPKLADCHLPLHQEALIRLGQQMV